MASTTALLVVAGMVSAASPAAAIPNADIGFPVFAGSNQPVPTAPVDTDPSTAMLPAIFAADVAAGAGSDSEHDFWIDSMLARTGTAGDPVASNSDQNRYLFSRGRTLFMKDHTPGALGFGGDVAYIESIDGAGAFTVSLAEADAPVELTEDTAARKQTPSYWHSVHTADTLSVTQTKYITDNNVAVAGLVLTNTGTTDRTLVLTAADPRLQTADGDELTGTVHSFNDLTVLYPRLSGDGFAVADTDSGKVLRRSVTVPAGGQVSTKLQEGFVTAEIAESRSEYDAYRTATPAQAYTTHVSAYNKWWADNIPYIDIPDKNIEKSLYYRWWLMRFNFLDANIPGNDYQFPTAVEGVLGYNNAIVLTSGMFIDDLKYLRDPHYAYGTWVSAGEVAKSGKYTDNPGDPANWSNSYTQYITEAAWRAYQLHGGPAPIAASLGRYGENDIKGLLADFDTNGNDLIEYDWGAMTGNDADAVSFHWRPGAAMDRTESAYLYSNAKASAAAYRTAGQTAKADEMDALAARVRQAVLDVLWDPADKLLKHRIVGGDEALVPWKEINNYYPFSVGLMPTPDGTAESDQYVEALRLWADADEYPIFPFFTANQKDKAEAAAAGEPGSNNFSVINSTVTFRFLSQVLRNYPNDYITPDFLAKLLSWNAWAQYQGGDNRYPDQNEFWADGTADPQKIGYRSWIHHTILGATNFTVIEDVAGLRTTTDGTIELDPIDIGWDHFVVNNLKVRDRDVTLVWDKPGDGNRPYGEAAPEGYSIYLDGQRVLTVDSLAHLVFDPNTGEVTFPEGDAQVVSSSSAVGLASPDQVTFADDERVVDLFAKAGQNISATDGVPSNLAQGAAVTATFAADGRAATNAVDGSTANEPFWGTAGSTSATDSIEVDFGQAQTFDDIRPYFYRTSTTGTVAGYAEPAAYQLEYLNGDQWTTIPGQLRTPTVPAGNFNESRFAPITAQKIRLTVTHQPGWKTAVKEVEVYSTGRPVTSPGNQAPVVSAYADIAGSTPGSVKLVGSAKDDGLPQGTVSAQWSVVSAPDGAAAAFTDPTSPSTSVRFSAEGQYVLRLSVSDGELSSHVDLPVDGSLGQPDSNLAPGATPSADYTAGWNSVNAVNDGKGSNTGGNQIDVWGTWSGTRPETRWLQYTWPEAVTVDSSDIMFWHDSPAGSGDGVAVPSSWKIQYLDADGQTWVDVANPSGYPTAETGTNATTFDPVTTTALRAVFTASTNGTSFAAVGVSEWKVLTSVPPPTVDAVHVPTVAGTIPELPAQVTLVDAKGNRESVPVTWQPITEEQVATPGTSFVVAGVAEGGALATATVWVRVTDAVQINTIDPVAITTVAAVAPQLPATVTALYNDGSKDSRIGVAWAAIDPAEYAVPGTFEVTGTVDGTDKVATATVTVIDGDGGGEPTLAESATAVALSANEIAIGAPLSADVTVTGDGDSAPTGTVDVLLGDSVVGTGHLAEGKVTVSVDTSGLAAGENTLTVRYSGDAAFTPSEATATVTATKATSSVKVAVNPANPSAKKPFTVTVSVATDPASVAAAGRVTVKLLGSGGKKVVATATGDLVDGAATLTFRSVSPGRYTLTASYSGSDQVAASSTTTRLQVRGK